MPGTKKENYEPLQEEAPDLESSSLTVETDDDFDGESTYFENTFSATPTAAPKIIKIKGKKKKDSSTLHSTATFNAALNKTKENEDDGEEVTYEEFEVEKQKAKTKIALLTEKIRKNKLFRKLTDWFMIDAAGGTLASILLVSLYSLLWYTQGFPLPLGLGNVIFPLFIVADLISTVASWGQFITSWKLNKQRNDDNNRSRWTGNRNKFLRGIAEILFLITGAVAIIGGIAAPALFLPVLPKVFMGLLACRTAFNLVSGITQLVRAHRNKKLAADAEAAAENMKPGKERDDLLKQALEYKQDRAVGLATAKVQLLAAAASALGLLATTLIMFKAIFVVAPLGVVAGLALGGVMGYINYNNYKDRSANKTEKKELRAERDIEKGNLNTLEATEMAAKKNQQAITPLKKEVSFLRRVVTSLSKDIKDLKKTVQENGYKGAVSAMASKAGELITAKHLTADKETELRDQVKAEHDAKYSTSETPVTEAIPSLRGNDPLFLSGAHNVMPHLRSTSRSKQEQGASSNDDKPVISKEFVEPGSNAKASLQGIHAAKPPKTTDAKNNEKLRRHSTSL